MEEATRIEIIMPEDIKKYRGGVKNHFKYKHIYIATFEESVLPGEKRKRRIQNFDNYDEAFIWVKCQNQLENNINVKNIIYNEGNNYSCDLGSGHKMLFDESDIKLVQSHIWHCERGYARTNISDDTGKHPLYFHRLKMGPPPEGEVTDHRNRNRGDNRGFNLRFVPIRINALNKGLQSNNTSGRSGVYFSERDDAWVASYTDEAGKFTRVYFHISTHGEKAEHMANDKRDEAEKLPHYREAYGTNDMVID